jgi:hypothetical protein
MISITRNKTNFLIWSLAIIAFSLMVVPQKYIPIWGDDFLLLRAANAFQGYGSEVSLAPFQTGMTKYRPIFLVTFAAMHNFLGDQLSYYLIFNSGLTLALGLCFGLLLRETTELRSIAIPFGIVSISTLRFLWFSREWIFGSMEIISLCASLLTIVFYLRLTKKKEPCARNFLLANLFLVGAIFTHERAVAVGVAASIFFAILNRKNLISFTATQILIPFLIVITSFLLKIFVLQVNPLQGSLANYVDLDSKNTVLNVMTTIPGGLLKILGFSTYQTFNFAFDLLQLLLSLLLTVSIVVVLAKLFVRNFDAKGKSNFDLDTNALSINSLLVLLVGALSFGTNIFEPIVQERFLVLPQLMFWILVINSAGLILPKARNNLPALVALIALLSIELSYLPAKANYYPTQTRVTSAFMGLDANLNGSEPWVLKLRIDDELRGELNWALGYPSPSFSGVFSTSINPPIIYSTDSRSLDLKCLEAEFQSEIYVATITPC